MQLTSQRGAIPIVLDRPRTLFFAMGATALLVERYGMHFATELYKFRTIEEKDKATKLQLELKGVHALAFFLYAGLQEELKDTGETITFEQAQTFIHPWTVNDIFTKVVAALTGAMAMPEQPGKEGAASQTPKPAAKKNVAKPAPKAKPAKKPGRKVSTLKVRSGLRLAR